MNKEPVQSDLVDDYYTNTSPPSSLNGLFIMDREYRHKRNISRNSVARKESNMEYTKGEWKVDPNWHSGDYQDRTGYAIYIQRGHEQHLICDLIHTVDRENQEANAHLIKASPRLHRQLIRSNELIKWLDAEYRLSQNHQTSDNIDLVVTENNKALASAEGREE